MEFENINLKVVQATSIDQFCISPGGKRRLYMHYFLKMPEGERHEWQYRWVDSTLDPACLEDWIEEGRVYIFPQDGSICEVNPLRNN